MSNQKKEYKPGDLQVWWIPQVPMEAFEVDVSSVEVAALLMNALADYDKFQFEKNIKPDYCNAGGLKVWSENSDGEGNPGWEDWYDEETLIDDPCEWLALKQNE